MANGHKPTQASKVPNSSRYHYKSWSHLYECAACHRQGRFNSNYLGQRVVFCDGAKFTKVKTLRDKRLLDRAFAVATGACA